MNKDEYKIIQQLRELEVNVPPQVRTLRWFWSFQDLMAKFGPTDPLPDPDLEEDIGIKVIASEKLEVGDALVVDKDVLDGEGNIKERHVAKLTNLEELDDAEVLQEDLKGEDPEE